MPISEFEPAERVKPMTAAELIEALQKVSPDAIIEIGFSDSEYGPHGISDIAVVAYGKRPANGKLAYVSIEERELVDTASRLYNYTVLIDGKYKDE